MVRDIIEIDEDLCVGCGNCVPNCHQGALQIIDGKARLISDLMCEGIGVCVGHCPTGAMTVEKREAAPYDERKVMEKICAGGPNVIAAHLEHLRLHNQTSCLAEAIDYLDEHGMATGGGTAGGDAGECGDGGGCPGSRARTLHPSPAATPVADDPPSELRQWPVQLHLVNPLSDAFREADVLLAADCTAFAMGGFHRRLLRGKALAIGCPKLDDNLETYVEKLTRMIDEARINTLTVVMMEVPCCGGLLQVAQAAASAADRHVPIKRVILSLDGRIDEESWVG